MPASSCWCLAISARRCASAASRCARSRASAACCIADQGIVRRSCLKVGGLLLRLPAACSPAPALPVKHIEGFLEGFLAQIPMYPSAKGPHTALAGT